MEIKNISEFESAARSITEKPAGGSRGTDKYNKAVQALIKLSKASSGFIVSKQAYKEAIVKSEYVEFNKDKNKNPLPPETKNIKYGFTDFRISYKYNSSTYRGTMTSAIIRSGKYYLGEGGDTIFLIPESKFPAFKEALLKTKSPDLKKLVSSLEDNFDSMYPPTLASEVEKATS